MKTTALLALAWLHIALVHAEFSNNESELLDLTKKYDRLYPWAIKRGYVQEIEIDETLLT